MALLFSSVHQHSAGFLSLLHHLDLVLAKDLNQMIPYIYTVVNNKTIDAYRSATKEHNRVISLDETLDRHDGDDNSKKTKTLEDNLSDKSASAETRLIAKEAVLALFEKYCGNADALLCMIATKVFNDTPREIAEMHDGVLSRIHPLYESDSIQELRSPPQ